MQGEVIYVLALIGLMLGSWGLSPGVAAQEAAQIANEPVRVAVDHLRNLEYDQARQGLKGWLQEHPDDLYAGNYLATAVLYQEMFRQDVLESTVYGEGGEVFKPSKVPVTPEFQKELFTVLDKAQGLADQRRQKDPRDKDAMYWAGVTHGTRATYHFTLRREYKQALREATAAHKLHDQLLVLDANYVDALLILGVNNYVVGSLPWYLKVIASLTGRHGDKVEGLQQIQRTTREGHYAREDAQLVLAVLYQREKMYREALPLYQRMAAAYPRNYLFPQEVAALYGLLGDWANATKEYDDVIAKYRAGEPNFDKMPATRMFYLAAQAHERLGETEAALTLYSEAVQTKGEDKYRRKADLAAADIEARLWRTAEARERYQRVAQAAPESEEGKLAKKALRKLSAD